MPSAHALGIFSGKFIFYIAELKRLRSFQFCAFTEWGRSHKQHLACGADHPLLPATPLS